MNEHDLQEVLTRFKVGDPIKTLFNPKFELLSRSHFDVYHEDVIRIRLSIEAPDAYGKLGVIPVRTERHIHVEDLKHFDERYLLETLRTMLHGMLVHEADEAVLFDGRRIFDPHRHEPKYMEAKNA